MLSEGEEKFDTAYGGKTLRCLLSDQTRLYSL